MPSVINTPTPVVATAGTTGGATEVVVITSNPVNIDTPESVVLIQFDCDFLNSASGATITWKVRRTSLTGTLVTAGNTWGPYTLVASGRSPHGFTAFDTPGASSGLLYVVTATIASNAATATFETAIMAIQVQSGS